MTKPPPFGCECGRRWGGLAECHCAECHLHFLSVTGFDRHRWHRIGKRGDVVEWESGCSAPREMLKLGRNGKPRMVPAERLYGTVWVSSLRND